MLPRTESIFNIGEVSSEEPRYLSGSSRCRTIRGAQDERLQEVGLRILIQSHMMHNYEKSPNNIVLKPTSMKPNYNLKSNADVLGPRRSAKSCPSLPESDFLKACCFCKKELSLEKDVFMYRGDQGFCSVECRYQQILLDEKRELQQWMKKKPSNQHHRHRSIPKTQQYYDRRRRLTSAA